MRRGRWLGPDASNSESLFEYSFLLRKNGDMYEVVVKYGNGYVYGLFDDRDFIDDMNRNLGKENASPSWESLSEYTGADTEDYRQYLLGQDRDNRALSLLTDALSYYQTEAVVSISEKAETYSEKEIRRKLGRALK